MLSSFDRDQMERRRRELEAELEGLADAAEDDELAEARLDAVKLELERIALVLYPEDADRQRHEGRSERD
jgi:hypothetical protein